MADDDTIKKVKYQKSEESPIQDVVTQGSPLPDVAPESPLQDVVPQESPLQEVVPPESPLQEVVPPESPLQDVIPPESPLQDVVTPESPLPDLGPPESPLQGVVPQESPLQDVVPQELPLQEVDHRESQLSDGEPRKSQLSFAEPHKSAPQNFNQWTDLKKQRVREASHRLKLREGKERESQKRPSPQGNVSREKIEKDIKFVTSDESSISSTSSSSLEASDDDLIDDVEKLMKAKYKDVEDEVMKTIRAKDDDVEDMMTVENESFTELVPPEMLSVAEGESSEDPMFTKVDELMLVPSISDLSLSDDPSVKREVSLKSVASVGILSRAESDSLESESEDSSESLYSLRKSGDERPDDFTELVIEDRLTTEINEVAFAEFPRSEKSIDFTDLFFESNTKIRESSIAESPQKMDKERVVSDFIDMLISQVTSGPSADELRRSRLDKNKLHDDLRKSMAEHMELAMLNDLLNGLVAEFYKINKNIRALAELSEEDRKGYYNRYRNGLACVAYGEERVAAARAAAHRLTVMAQLELNNAMLGSLGTEHHFDQTVRRVLLRDSEDELLQRLIAREMRLMTQYRTEISYYRYLMISLKHELAKLRKEIDDLDSVGGHVSMNDFLLLQSKVVGFERKIEERNIELKKMRVQYHKELHLTQHNREKIKALKDNLLIRREQLEMKNEKRNNLKEKLYLAKIHRKSMQDKSKELTYQGGILSMPSLMHDYDRTLDFIRQKQESIAGLKETIRSITQRLDTMHPKGSKVNVNSVLIS